MQVMFMHLPILYKRISFLKFMLEKMRRYSLFDRNIFLRAKNAGYIIKCTFEIEFITEDWQSHSQTLKYIS